jgi:hypothetical protein
MRGFWKAIWTQQSTNHFLCWLRKLKIQIWDYIKSIKLLSTYVQTYIMYNYSSACKFLLPLSTIYILVTFQSFQKLYGKTLLFSLYSFIGYHIRLTATPSLLVPLLYTAHVSFSNYLIVGTYIFLSSLFNYKAIFPNSS